MSDSLSSMGQMLTELPSWVIQVWLFVFGAMVGSFANVVIYRWPLQQSVVRPRSRCPGCGKPISWYDNIPILSWCILRGKCRNCKTTISYRYPLVELLMGVLWVLLFHYAGLSWTLLEYLIFISALVAASFIDLDHFLLPDVLTLSGIVIGLVGAFLNPEREFLPALLGVLVGGGFLWAIAYVYFLLRKEEGMGGGDIKLLAWIGAVLGWQAIPFVIIVASLAGSVLGLALSWRRKKGLKTVIPFGPYLAFAALLYICGGTNAAHIYLSWFIPDL